LADIEKETVDFMKFDDTCMSQSNANTCSYLLIWSNWNCCRYATNMPPHNLTEVINGTLAYMDNNDIEIDELINHIKAPDFPTGGIYGYEGVREAFKTGRGRV
jgi:DNA gyrase subunit A